MKPNARPVGFRPHMPLSVKLTAALDTLGIEEPEFDHDPALSRRKWDPEAGDTIPPANDPKFITVRSKRDHTRKTNGGKATTLGSDKHEAAKTTRLTDDQIAFRRRLLAKTPGQKREKNPRWPSRKIQSRPMRRKANG